MLIIKNSIDLYFTDPEIGDMSVCIILPNAGLHHSLHRRISVTGSNVMPGRKLNIFTKAFYVINSCASE